MIDWRASETSPGDFNIANTKLVEAKGSFEKKDYISYLDTLSAAVEARNKAKSSTDAQKASILKTIGNLESESSSLEANIRPLLQELNPSVKGYLPSFLIPEDRFQEALAYKKEARQLIQVENHDNYFKAQLLLSKCKNMLETLSSYLSNARHKAQANSEYNKNVSIIEDEKFNKQGKLVIAVMLISIAAAIGIIGSIFMIKAASWGHESGWAAGFVFLVIGPSSIFIMIADRIWSIGANEPGKKFNGWWLCLSLATVAVGLVDIVLAIVVYVRGSNAINSEYSEKMLLAGKQRV